MRAAQTLVFKLLGGAFEAFRPAGGHIAPMVWNRLFHTKFHHNMDLW